MASDDQQLGELIGEVRALGERFTEMRKETSRAFDEMKRENAADHATVVASLEALSSKVDGKAPTDWVRDLDGRVDGLEGERDERKGKLLVGGLIFSVIVGPSLVGVFILLATGVLS